jgi:hypothetical protein
MWRRRINDVPLPLRCLCRLCIGMHERLDAPILWRPTKHYAGAVIAGRLSFRMRTPTSTQSRIALALAG